MERSEAQKQAELRYRKTHVRQVNVKFFPADMDLYDWLQAKSDRNKYLKALIRADMEREHNPS